MRFSCDGMIAPFIYRNLPVAAPPASSLEPLHVQRSRAGGDAEASVAADLELLAAARRRREELAAQEAAEAAEWLPPQGQRGDGRTSLNDKLGY